MDAFRSDDSLDESFDKYENMSIIKDNITCYETESTNTNSITVANYSENTKINKRKRRAQDYDYESEIASELQKFQYEKLKPDEKNNLIKKIRNRISAKRSRNKLNNTLSDLMDKINNLENINKMLVEENNSLKQLVSKTNCESSVSSKSSDNVTRVENSKNVFFPFIFIVSLIALMVFAKETIDDSLIIKIGGFIPFIGNNIYREKSLKSQDVYDKYCPYDNIENFLKNLIPNYEEFKAKTISFEKYNIKSMICINHNSSKEQLTLLLNENSPKNNSLSNYYYANLIDLKLDNNF